MKNVSTKNTISTRILLNLLTCAVTLFLGQFAHAVEELEAKKAINAEDGDLARKVYEIRMEEAVSVRIKHFAVKETNSDKEEARSHLKSEAEKEPTLLYQDTIDSMFDKLY